MTTPESVDVREAAGRWLHDFTAAVRGVTGLVSWESGDEDDREYWRARAEPFLAAVTPVIRRQVAEEIARDIETATGSPMWYAMVPEAAAIARSHSIQPGEET